MRHVSRSFDTKVQMQMQVSRLVEKKLFSPFSNEKIPSFRINQLPMEFARLK